MTTGPATPNDNPFPEPFWFEPACALLAGRLIGALGTAFDGPAHERASEICATIVQEIEAGAWGGAVPAAMLDPLRRLLAERTEGPLAARLWGRAVARAVVCLPDRLAVAAYLVEVRFAARDALIGALTEALRSPDRERLLEGFQGIVTEIRDHPENGTLRDGEHFRQWVGAWRNGDRLDALWNGEFNRFSWASQSLGLLRALRPLDPRRYLAMFEKTALPLAVEQELWARDLRSDLTGLLTLLEAAPLVQDDPERPRWNGRMAAPLLLSVALEHATQAAGAQRWDELNEAQETAARARLDAVAGTLLTRPDGRFLALHWLAHLIGADRRRQTSLTARLVVRSAIAAVADGLAAGGHGHAQVRWAFPRLNASAVELKALRESGTGQAREYRGTTATDAFLATLMLEAPDGTPRDAASRPALLKMYRTILFKRDPGLSTCSGGPLPNGGHFHLAMLFLECEFPAGIWRGLWQSLSEQRRRARHRHGDDGGDDPSFFHLCVGMALVDWLCQERPDAAGAVWSAAFDAAFATAPTALRTQADRWRDVIAKLFARLPRVVRAQDPSAEVAGEAAAQLVRLGGDDALLASCTATVLLNGVSICDLARACTEHGVDLRSRLEAFSCWEARTGSRRPASPLLALVAEMLADLSVGAGGAR